MVFVWAKQETVLAVLKKMSAVLSICPAICERIFGGTLFIFINREDRRYTKKMTLANKSAIFLYFYSFSAYYAYLGYYQTIKRNRAERKAARLQEKAAIK